jgi:hypothetical protein
LRRPATERTAARCGLQPHRPPGLAPAGAAPRGDVGCLHRVAAESTRSMTCGRSHRRSGSLDARCMQGHVFTHGNLRAQHAAPVCACCLQRAMLMCAPACAPRRSLPLAEVAPGCSPGARSSWTKAVHKANLWIRSCMCVGEPYVEVANETGTMVVHRPRRNRFLDAFRRCGGIHPPRTARGRPHPWLVADHGAAALLHALCIFKLFHLRLLAVRNAPPPHTRCLLRYRCHNMVTVRTWLQRGAVSHWSQHMGCVRRWTLLVVRVQACVRVSQQCLKPLLTPLTYPQFSWAHYVGDGIVKVVRAAGLTTLFEAMCRPL